MEELCNLCFEVIDRNDSTVWSEARGWVYGPKQNGFTLSEKTGNFAHDKCVRKAQAGQDPAQATLFDMPEEPTKNKVVDATDFDHMHKPIQHRDGKPPWCPACGLTAKGAVPISFMDFPT